MSICRASLLCCVLLGACSTQNALGPVQVSGTGTSMAGDAVLLLQQLWQNGLADGNTYYRDGVMLVHEDGSTTSASYAPQLLATDCSDQPSSVGDCIAGTKTTTAGPATSWTYPLVDGSKVTAYLAGTTARASRIAADGSMLWMRTDIIRPEDAIRGGTLLFTNYDAEGATKIDVLTGTTVWSVATPASL